MKDLIRGPGFAAARQSACRKPFVFLPLPGGVCLRVVGRGRRFGSYHWVSKPADPLERGVQIDQTGQG